MLNKIQVTLCILAGVAIVVFITAICTNIQVKQAGVTPGWVSMAVLGAFGLTVASSLGVVVTQILEFREPKAKKEADEALADEETPADEEAPVDVTADDESIAEMDAIADVEGEVHDEAHGEPAADFESPAAEPAAEDAHAGFESHEETVEEIPEFGDFTTEFTDFEEEK